jgi:PAS domain S-box-containing protein
MTDSLHHSVVAGKDSPQSSQRITEADVLMTGVLASRPARQPDLVGENQALRTLAQHLMDEPQSLLKTLVGIALNLCRADTVGVSLLETAPNGESIFRWVAIAGVLEQFEQTTTPGNFSPCGRTLSCNQPQLYSHPERYFTYLYDPQYPIVEGLLIPLGVNDHPLGTLWILSHDEARHFDTEDQRLMMSLGGFTASALYSMQQLQQTAATALHQSETFNQQILDSSNDCIKVLDLEGRILFMSRGGQALLGIQDITPLLNTSWVEFWSQANQQAAIEAINRARAGEVCTLQGYCPTLLGEPKWWDNKISPIRGADGQVERLLCISRDITAQVRLEEERRRIENDRKQAQEKLRESEERYRAIVNQAVTGVACTNLSGKFTLVNQKYCDITGYSAAELSQLRMHDITHPEDLPRNVELFNRMLAEGTPFEIEKRYIRKDGSIVWVNNSVSAIYDREGKLQSFVAISLDITERKQTEEALRSSEEQFRLFVTASSDMVYKMSGDWSEMRNLEGKDFLASTQNPSRTWLEQYIPQEEQPLVLATIQEAIRTKGTFELEHRVIRLDGTVGWTFSRAIPLLDAQNEIIEWFGAASDVTVRKQAEETLQQAHNALRQQANQLEQANEILQSTLSKLQDTQNQLIQQNEDLAITRDLAEQERHRYQDLFNCAPDGYVVTDAQGIIQEANQAIAALVAIERRKLIDTPLAAYISIPDQRAFRNLLWELHHESGVQKLQTDELSLQHPGGHPASVAPIPVAITGTAICNAQAQVVGVRWLIQDISDRKQAEAQREQLLAQERHYANQLQGLTNAALAINSALSVEQVLQVITDRAASIIGTHQSVTSLTIDQNWTQAINTIYLSDKYAAWRDYNEPTDGSGIYACVCHLNRPMRMTQAELEAHQSWKGFGKAADKHPPLRGWLAAPLVGRDGHNIGLIQLSDKYEGEFTEADESIVVQLAQMASVAVENARLYEAEQQARSAAEASREEAEAANRVKDEFLAVLSHELRSPLNPILGWSKLLQTRKLDETKTLQALSTIERNAKLQSELIEDLLDVSRILRGKLSLNVAPVNLASIIRAAMETVRLAAEAKSIQLEASLAPDVGLVSGDSTRLQQVMWNLLSNAVKFTPPEGQVNIRLERLDSYAHITVSDTGQGIAPEFLPYVFDYFRQANATTTRKFGGLGLGLAIVRHLVELHGGTVRAESPGEEQGATFVVRFPLMPTPLKANQDERSALLCETLRERSSASLSREQFLDLNGIKILVVDDETDTRELVAFVLEQQGAQVITASSAHEALLVLTQAKPDVLLSDIGMPDMDGYMLIQQVRTLAPEQGGQIPAIALTAYAGETNQQQVIAAGFQKHISKPIEPEVLVQAIAQLVRPT